MSLVQAQSDTLAMHRPYLYRYALSKLRRTDTAEELVQDTLLAALEALATFRGDSEPRTWLTGILKHKIVDWQRRESRNPLRTNAMRHSGAEDDYEETSDMLFDSAGRWVTPPSTWPTPEQSLENQRFRELLNSCLAALPAATARAFYLREVEGLTTEEICAELGISESNCWVMLYRARMSLRRSLEERWFQKARTGITEKVAPARRGAKLRQAIESRAV